MAANQDLLISSSIDDVDRITIADDYTANTSDELNTPSPPLLFENDDVHIIEDDNEVVDKFDQPITFPSTSSTLAPTLISQIIPRAPSSSLSVNNRQEKITIEPSSSIIEHDNVKSISPIPDDPDVTIVRIVKQPTVDVTLDAIWKRVVAFPASSRLLDAIKQAMFDESRATSNSIDIRQLIRSPTSISLPPSFVVDILVEYEPKVCLRRIISALFGDDARKMGESERRERQQVADCAAPNMTRLLMDIGLDLAQETTYSDVVHFRNLPEPRNVDTLKDVAAQLRPVWESLRRKNEPYKLKWRHCKLCGFRSESCIVMAEHRRLLHFDGRKWQCTMCNEIDTNECRMQLHYREEHHVEAIKEELPPRNPCPCCDDEFQLKGQREIHMKTCRRDALRMRYPLKPVAPGDYATINRQLWDKPFDLFGQQQQLRQQKQIASRHMRPLLPGITTNTRAPNPRQLMTGGVMLNASGSGAKRTVVSVTGASMMNNVSPMAQARLQSLMTLSQNIQQNASLQIPPTMHPAFVKHHGSSAQLLRPIAAKPIVLRSTAPALLQRQTSTPPQQRNLADILNSQLSMQQQLNRQQRTNTAAALVQKHSGVSKPPTLKRSSVECEICDQLIVDCDRYLDHLQLFHKQMNGKTLNDMQSGAPLSCSRCGERFWTYEGLERHLVMTHGLVTSELLAKAQNKEDGGRCKMCQKNNPGKCADHSCFQQYAFNMLQHLVTDHNAKLSSAEIVYSCDMCAFRCNTYAMLESHLNESHQKPTDLTSSGVARSLAAKHTNNKSTLPKSSPTKASSTKPVKRMNATGVAGAPPAKRSTRTIKYTCTPCDLKFELYADVIAHWQTTHLQKVSVVLCRCDCCPTHRAQLLDEFDCKFDFGESTGAVDGGDEEVITLD